MLLGNPVVTVQLAISGGGGTLEDTVIGKGKGS